MKANKILVAMGVGSMLLCGSAVAAGGAGSGKVTFNGEIINAPCSVAPESVDQVVEMGQISTKELANGGESNSKPFSIKLLNCEISDKAEDAVKVTFSGAKDPVDSTLLVIGGGDAAGAGIKMTAPGGAPIELGKPTAAFGLVNGDNELLFSAVLKGYDDPANPLKAGAFTAVTNFTLSYE